MNEPPDDLAALPDPLRSWDVPSVIGMGLNAVIPLITLIWTITSGYWFWSETLGSPWFGIASVILEAMGLIGLLLYLSGWDDRNLWVQWRRLLPYVPIPSLSYAIHSMVERNAAWVSSLTTMIEWNYQLTAWTFTIACVAALTFLSHVGWKTLEEELDDMFGSQEKRIQRWKQRQLRQLQAARASAASQADVAAMQIAIEIEKLQRALPGLQAKAAEMQQLVEGAAVKLEALRQAQLSINMRDEGREINEGGITIETVKAALLIATGASQTWTARVCGISRRRLREWINGGDPAGWAQNVLNAASKEMVQDALSSFDPATRQSLENPLTQLGIALTLEENAATISSSANGSHP